MVKDPRVKTDTRSEDEIRDVLKQCRRTPVDISSSLVEAPVEINNNSEETQTGNFMPRPKSPPYIPKKTGIDCGTQIDDNVFDFDKEVEPILDVIISKTLEQSLIEVNRESEMACLKVTKESHLEENQRLLQIQKQREQQEVKQHQEKLIVIRENEERLEKEILVSAKAATCHLYSNVIGSSIEANAMKHLTEIEYFRDDRKDAILLEFMPWLQSDLERRLEQHVLVRKLTDCIIQRAIGQPRELALEYRQQIIDRKQDEEAKRMEEKRLKQEAEENEEIRRRFEEEKQKIQIFLRGEEILGEESVGPITLSLKHTIFEAESAIENWLLENLDEGNKIEKPEGGYLSLALQLSVDEGFDPTDDNTTLEFLHFLDDSE